MLLTGPGDAAGSGPELAQRIRQIDPGISVLFMSEYSKDVLGPRGGLDADAPLIQEPFAAQELLKAVRGSLG